MPSLQEEVVALRELVNIQLGVMALAEHIRLVENQLQGQVLQSQQQRLDALLEGLDMDDTDDDDADERTP
jgi:hypothetical protein